MRNLLLFSHRMERFAFSLLLLGIFISRPCAASGPVAIIAVQPLGISVSLLGIATFQVVAVSGTTMSYQWLKNGSAIPGATSANYTILNAQPSDQGTYCVQISNGGGTVTSSNAVLTVNNAPPTITSQPQSEALSKHDNASFTVVAIGTGSLSYQWKLNGTSLTGATSSTLALNKISSGNAGSYTVVVTNSIGSVTSSVATLTVDAISFITTQPQSLAVSNGQRALFSVTAISDSSIYYQWYLNGTALAGATSLTLTLANVQTNTVGSYKVVLQNNQGSTTSAVAILAIYGPPVITIPPQSQAVVQGQNAIFGITAIATGAIGYQWNFNGAPLAGATNAALTLTNVQRTQAGNYTVVATDSLGSVTSAVATLMVNVPPSITTQPQSQGAIVGQRVVFSVLATGTEQLNYQWRLNGTPLAGATNATLSLDNVQPANNGNYQALVTNSAGSATSVVAALTVITTPPTLQGAGITANGFSLQLPVPVGRTYIIMASTDGQNWAPIYTNVALTGNITFTDTASASYRQRFYQAVVQ